MNYLLLEGTHDRQVPSVIGSRVFQRVRFTDPGRHYMKSSLYIGGANHSQFNSDWGIYDLSFPTRVLTYMSAQLGASGQRDIAKTCVSAFLDATLKGDERYIPLFRDYRLMQGWLPKTTYVSRYEDSGFRPIADFDEDIDLSTTTIPGGTISGEGLTQWREQDIDLRGTRNIVEGMKPSDRLMFSIGFPDTTTSPEISVVLTDRNGQSASLPLSRIFPVKPAQRYSLTRLGFLEKPSQVLILQTVSIPLTRFMMSNPRLDLACIQRIDFQLDPIHRGRILLDDIGVDIGKDIPAA